MGGRVSGQRYTLTAFYPRRRDPRYPLDRRLGGPRQVWTQTLEKNFFASAEDGTPVVQSVVRH
jgi:hypothetical protein